MNGIPAAERVIIALDCPLDQARSIARKLAGRARWLKIGMTLFYAEGPAIVREFKELGYKVFIDLKLHDIPHQVKGAARAVTLAGADMFTVHASGGAAMVAAAVEGSREALEDAATTQDTSVPIILGVTVLTSMDQQTLASIGVERPVDQQVSSLARLTVAAGANGIVCSPLEAEAMRSLLGEEAAIVTPGVRLAAAKDDDQSRVMTPSRALAAGSDYLVIGRPITQAEDPVAAFDSIVKDMED